jgi:CTP:molybdopterin cytidylyltransferase MocA
MGDFKPLLPCGNSTMIQTTIESLQQANATQIIVVVGHRGDEIEKVVSQMDRVQVIYNPNYQNGEMLESIQLGLKHIGSCDAAFVLPGDMPAIAQKTFRQVKKCMRVTNAAVVFPTLEGRQKHPPLIAERCFESICRFSGDGGLRTVLQQFREETAFVAVDDFGCTIDADTPADYHQLLHYCHLPIHPTF